MTNAKWIPTGYAARFETRLGELDALVTRSERGQWWWEVSSNGCVIERGGPHTQDLIAQEFATVAARRHAAAVTR